MTVVDTGNGCGLIALQEFEVGQQIAGYEPRFHAAPTRFTIQVGSDRHLDTEDFAGRFVNHSCDPNAAFDTDSLAFVALRPIAIGEEITFDYLDRACAHR